ncbi:MAG TPA: MFS transporter [Anaerolineales bacterium]
MDINGRRHRVRDPVAHWSAKPHQGTEGTEEKHLQISKEGFAAAKDPGVALAYMAAFVSRGANAVILAVALASIGYGSTIFVSDPTGGLVFLVTALIGIGEISGVIASGVLIAQQAPRDIRGSVIGIFSLSGTFGIMAATGIGGQLFDKWLPQGPFVMFSILGFIVVAIGLVIRKRIVPRNENANGVVGH